MRPSPGFAVLQKNLMSDAQSPVVETSPSPLRVRGRVRRSASPGRAGTSAGVPAAARRRACAHLGRMVGPAASITLLMTGFTASAPSACASSASANPGTSSPASSANAAPLTAKRHTRASAQLRRAGAMTRRVELLKADRKRSRAKPACPNSKCPKTPVRKHLSERFCPGAGFPGRWCRWCTE